jgi:hypothetical protein
VTAAPEATFSATSNRVHPFQVHGQQAAEYMVHSVVIGDHLDRLVLGRRVGLGAPGGMGMDARANLGVAGRAALGVVVRRGRHGQLVQLLQPRRRPSLPRRLRQSLLPHRSVFKLLNRLEPAQEPFPPQQNLVLHTIM